MSEIVEKLATAEYSSPSEYPLDEPGDRDRVVIARVLIDESMSVFDDGDWFGALEWTRGNDYGPVRPFTMNGRAEILRRDYHEDLWWQPPSDVTDLDAFRSNLLELLEFGYIGISVEVCEGTDVYGRLIPCAEASLWGIPATADTADRAEIIGDLLAELGIEQ